MRKRKLGKLCCFILLIFSGIFQTGIRAQEIVLDVAEYDTVYVDSIYDLAVGYIFRDKMFEKGEPLVEEGLRYTINNENDHIRFTYIKGMIYFLNRDVEDNSIIGYKIFSEIIRNQPKELTSEYRKFVMLSHQRLAWLDGFAGDEEGLKYHCEKAMKLSVWNDFDNIGIVYHILENYYKSRDSKLWQNYLLKRMINYTKEYIHTFLRFPSEDEKNLVYSHFLIIYRAIGYMYEQKIDYKAALYFYNQSYNYGLKNPTTSELYLAIAKQDLGYLHLFLKNYDKAELLGKEALTDNENLSIPSTDLETSCLVLLGDIRIVRKDYQQAKKYYEKALEKQRESDSGNSSDLPSYYVSIAIAEYHLGNYQSTIDYYEKAISLMSDKEGAEYIQYYKQMANAYYYIDKKVSEELHKEVLGMNLDYEIYTETKANVNYMLALLENQENKKESSLKKHMKARELYNSTPNHYGEESLNLIKIAEHNPGNKNHYIQYLNEAIIACLRNGKEYNVEKVPEYNDIIFPFLLIHAYKTLADYHIKNNSLDEALKVLKIAKKLIIVVKPMYKHDESKSTLVSASMSIYKRIVQIAYRKYKETGNSEYFNLAFDTMERSKSIHLMDALKSHNAFDGAGLPDSLYAYGQKLKTEIDFLKEELNLLAEAPAEEKKGIDDKLVNLHSKYNEYLLNIENNHPDYYRLKYADSTIDIEKIRKAIGLKELVVQYDMQDSLLAIITVGKDESSLVMKDIREMNLDSLTNGFIYAINQKENEVIKKNSKKLYDILLGDIIKDDSEYNKLTIIPDSTLNYLPFELLSKTEDIDSRLIYSVAVVYNYSAANIYEKRKNYSGRGFLGIAPTYSNKKFVKLPYAKKEIRQIGKSWKGEILEDQEANLENFKNYAQDFSIVHIAGHTEINDSFPLQSRMVFSELEDSIHSLYAYELYNMKLNLDMVVLSACNSGVGKIREGEGNMSLSRGFAYAGCPSTVTTLWPMIDEPTKDIMTIFYKNLKAGQVKSEALRNAKLTYLEVGGARIQDPIYWAGIVIVGSDVPLIKTGLLQGNLFYIFLSFVLLLLGGLAFRKYRK